MLSERDRTWTQTELAFAAGMHPKGSADEHLLALAQIGLVDDVAGHYRLRADHPLVEPLDRLLAAVRDLPDDLIARP